MALTAGSASAVDYSYGEVSGSIDTVLSAGASMRTSARDCRNLGQPSGGCRIQDASGVDKSSGKVNEDDGNLNYGQWDVFSGAMKATSEGAPPGAISTPLCAAPPLSIRIVDNTDFRDLDASARSEVSQNAKLLDYFVGGSFEVGGLPLELRGGNQVISWGESTFIQNGINVINPVDVSATRKPGSEVKEFFTPILAAKAALGLPNNFSLEGFYQFKADNIVPDPSGTFFSASDIVGRGSQPIRAGVNDIGDDARFNPFQVANGIDDDIFWQSRWASTCLPPPLNGPMTRMPMMAASSASRCAISMKNWNNGMEFGLYFINYHSRLPIASFSLANTQGAYSIASATNFSASSRAANALSSTTGGPATASELGGARGTGPGGAAANAFEATQHAV